MKNTLILILSILLFSNTVSAQEENKNISTKSHHIGAHAGISTGTGLSYRYWPDKLGVQITFLPLLREEFTRLTGGVTALYKLKEYEKLNFFLYFGNAFNYSLYFESTSHSMGLGPGFDITIAKDLGLNLMFGYHVWSFDPSDTPYKSGMTGEIGLYLKL